MLRLFRCMESMFENAVSATAGGPRQIGFQQSFVDPFATPLNCLLEVLISSFWQVSDSYV